MDCIGLVVAVISRPDRDNTWGSVVLRHQVIKLPVNMIINYRWGNLTAK
jgi:hypothetical protein